MVLEENEKDHPMLVTYSEVLSQVRKLTSSIKDDD